jgi:hypothetical protein
MVNIATCAFVGTALIFLVVLHELAGPRAVALAEGDARGNTLDSRRSAARSRSRHGPSPAGSACTAPSGGSQATRIAISRAVLTSIRDKAAAFDLVRGCWPSAQSTGTRTGRSRIRPRSTPCSRSANFSSAPTHYVNCSLVQSARASNWSSRRELGKSAPAPPCRPHLSS